MDVRAVLFDSLPTKKRGERRIAPARESQANAVML